MSGVVIAGAFPLRTAEIVVARMPSAVESMNASHSSWRATQTLSTKIEQSRSEIENPNP
jgi:hypothetical protein